MTAGNNLLTLNFREVDIKQFIESVSKLTKRNFLVDRRVSGKVTIIAANPIPKENLYDVMLSVLHFYGFAVVPDGDITKIVVAADAPRFAPSKVEEEVHELVTEVIKTDNIAAAQLTKVIRPMLSKSAQVVSLPKGDSLIISDVQTNVDRIKKIIASMDVVEVRAYDIIQLQHATAGDIISLINAIYKNNNKAINLNLQADKRTNRLIVTASRDVRKAIRDLVDALDTPIAGSANVKVVYLRYADAQNLANILGRLTSSDAFKSLVAEQAQSAGEKEKTEKKKEETEKKEETQSGGGKSDIKSGIQADTALNALIVSGSEAFIAAVEGIIQQLDVKRAQIIIETVIAELTDSFTRELGVDWATLSSSGGAIVDLSGSLGAVVGAYGATGNGFGAAARASELGRGGLIGAAGSIRDTSGWAALYRLLNTDSRSNVLSTPYIVTLDNEEASFTVGNNIAIRTSIVGTGDDRTTNIERKDVGIKLVIKPQVTGGDTVKLDINQEVSAVIPSADGAAGVTTTIRKITTTVQVRDGGLVALGGLLEDSQDESGGKVPGLGDIPYLGYLFRSQGSRLRKTNLMIFMRPRIIKDEAAIASYSYGKYNNLRQLQLNYPRFNSLLFQSEIPRLRDLSTLSFFIDLGERRTYQDLLVPQQ